jgi:predicted acylesterase/phospholipase RssA
MTIKHLVISGGGPSGLLTYGAASYLAKKGFWSLSNIESIYGCSIGAYMGVVFSLGYEWEWLDDYFIKRPWEKVVANSTNHLVDIYEQKCLINDQFFTEGIEPLLTAKDLCVTITLEEFYAFNHIDIHFYATNLNSVRLEKVDLSHTTHPSLSLITALRMTMAFPLIFQPIYDEENHTCCIDGGVLNNFPLNDCLQQTKCLNDEILAFKNIWPTQWQKINEKSSMLDFLLIVMKKVQTTLDTALEQAEVKHTVKCNMDDLGNLNKWIQALSSEELRFNCIEKGYKEAELFLTTTTTNV